MEERHREAPDMSEEPMQPSAWLAEERTAYRYDVPMEQDRRIIEQLVSRPFRDKAFSAAVKNAYHDTCAMTGLKIINGGGRSEVQAAHIRPVEHRGPDSVRNANSLHRLSRYWGSLKWPSLGEFGWPLGPYKTLKDFVAQLKKDPSSLSISVGSTRGAVNHFTIALLAKADGIDPKQLKILVFDGGAVSVTNLLGGHIDAMVQAASNAIPHVQTGKMRILGISMAKRSAAIPDVPTFSEQGFNVLMDGWYVFVGAKGLRAPQVAYWDAVFEKTVQNPEWQKFITQTGWESGYKNSKDTAVYIQKEYDEAKAILTELGMAAAK